jgi:tRNA modification GTPase
MLLAEAGAELAAARAEAAPELVAARLRSALDRLGEVSGAIPPDEVLGRIFSRFCIGK